MMNNQKKAFEWDSHLSAFFLFIYLKLDFFVHLRGKNNKKLSLC